MRWLGIALLSLLALAEPGWAQCAMCKSALEGAGSASLAQAFRGGIGLLLAAPYVVALVVGLVYWRRLRQTAQRRTMKRNRTLWIVGGLLAAAAGLTLYYAIADRGRSAPELPVYGRVPDFRLINHDEQPISLADLKGRYWVAEFFFASCAGICLQMNQNMRLVQQAFRDQPDRVKMV
ncbi:MAG: SCO family protein [Candidatus Bipolaricaulaceae bacterium]